MARIRSEMRAELFSSSSAMPSISRSVAKRLSSGTDRRTGSRGETRQLSVSEIGICECGRELPGFGVRCAIRAKIEMASSRSTQTNSSLMLNGLQRGRSPLRRPRERAAIAGAKRRTTSRRRADGPGNHAGRPPNGRAARRMDYSAHAPDPRKACPERRAFRANCSVPAVTSDATSQQSDEAAGQLRHSAGRIRGNWQAGNSQDTSRQHGAPGHAHTVFRREKGRHPGHISGPAR